MSGPTRREPSPKRKWTVWPYFVAGAPLMALGLYFAVFWWPPDYIAKADLVAVSGEVAKVAIRDDISGTSAGAMMPGFTAVFFTLKGVPGEFRYPYTRPQYLKVRDQTAVALDLLVDPGELAAGGVATIWQIRERNPHDKPGEETFVGYEEIVARLSETGWSMVRVGAWLMAAGLALLALGGLLVRLNRGRR